MAFSFGSFSFTRKKMNKMMHIAGAYPKLAIVDDVFSR